MRKSVNPEMVILARESRGLTQEELAQALFVSQGRISKIENGMLDFVPPDLLNKLCKTLNYPKSFFYANEQIYGLGMHLVYHRIHRSFPGKLLTKVHAQTNIMRIGIFRLLRSASLKNNKMFRADIDDYDGDIKAIAQAVRAAWLLPRGPIKNLTNAIENAGGIVVWCNFGPKALLDAISQWIPGFPPLFFVNANVPGDRLRFSLAHELGHVLMHRIPNPDMEKQANKFAAELLMPEEEIALSLRALTLSKLADRKLYWRVSMAALIMRAKDLKKITERQSSYFWSQMAKLGYKTCEPAELEIPKEEPNILKQMIKTHLDELKYTIQDLCQLLILSPEEFKVMYRYSGNILYVVG